MAGKYNAWQKAYDARPEQIKQRADQLKARRAAEKAGLVKKGDGKEVAHKKPGIEGNKATKGNTFIQDAKTNRGWRKGNGGKNSYNVPTVKGR